MAEFCLNCQLHFLKKDGIIKVQLQRRYVRVFNIGEIIVYGTEGVFCVSDYARSPVDKHDERVFYILKPAFSGDCNTIYAPSENGMVKMRTVISREEAESFIENMPSISALTVEQEKKRRQAYKDAMHNADLGVYVSIIKAVQEKISKVEKLLSDIEQKSEVLKKQWEKEKTSIKGEANIKSEIEKVKQKGKENPGKPYISIGFLLNLLCFFTIQRILRLLLQHSLT